MQEGDPVIARKPPIFALSCALLGVLALGTGCFGPTIGKTYSFYGESRSPSFLRRHQSAPRLQAF